MKGFLHIKIWILINDIRLFGMFILVPFRKRNRQIRKIERKKVHDFGKRKTRRWFTGSSKKTKDF